jgi:hypothetical protein
VGRCEGKGAAALKSRFFLDTPTSLTPRRWLLGFAAWYGHPTCRSGHFGAWVCLLGGCGYFRPLSAVVGSAEIGFLVFVLFFNCPYQPASPIRIAAEVTSPLINFL